jgi:hypothetical protein
MSQGTEMSYGLAKSGNDSVDFRDKGFGK